MTEKTTESRNLLDTKYGTVDPATIEEKSGKGDKTYLTATLVSGSGKETTVYAHGEKAMQTLREKAEAGEPFFVMGELIAKGTAISASKFDPVTYKGKVAEVTKEGANDSGPWALVKMAVEGKERPVNILATGDEVERLKGAGDAEVSVDVAWVAGKNGDRWMTSAQTANSLQRAPRPAVEDAPEPGM